MKFLLPLILLLSACVSTPTGSALSPEGQAALEVSLRIAVRHAVADSPRAAEKAQHIREIVARLQTVTGAESTLGALVQEVRVELNRFNLSPIDRADAEDLLTLLQAELEARLGPRALNSTGVVTLNKFLEELLKALPQV